MKTSITRGAWALALTLLVVATARGATRTWLPASGSGDWFDPLNWDGQTTIPAAGDVVVISTAGTVLLTNSTPALASLSLVGTISFSNWNTTLHATNVTVDSGGILMPSAAFTDVAMSNNVVIVCTNLLVASGGFIDANFKGYAGRSGNGYGPGYGANAGQGWGGGAGHGGQAYKIQLGGTISYGSATVPVTPGSSGYGQTTTGPAGGGVIFIDAPGGTVTVDGAIRADGEFKSSNGGGAGGSIYINCRRIMGTGGQILARGGSTDKTGNGNGAGGRIAIHYEPAAQQVVLPVPTLQISTRPGTGTGYPAEAGTLWFPDTYFLGTTITENNLAGQIWGITSWSPASLSVNNTWLGFAEPGFTLNVAGHVALTGTRAHLVLGGNVPVQTWGENMLASEGAAPAMTVGGNMTLDTGASFSVFATATNPPTVPVGATIDITGDLTLGANSRIYPHSHCTNGGSARFKANDISVASTARFDATAKGFAGGKFGEKGYGPGGSDLDPDNQYCPGAGHGGIGGVNFRFRLGGGLYGSVSDPTHAGSGGGCLRANSHGGRGGGLILIEAGGDIVLDGSMVADGETLPGGKAGVNYQNGAGSGGAINLTCRSITGSGTLSAKGGTAANDEAGDGGGGRIAIHYNKTVQHALPVPALKMDARPGYRLLSRMGGLGTLWLSSGHLVSSPIVHSGELHSDDFASWSTPSLTANSVWFRLPKIAVTVGGPLVVTGTSKDLHRFEGGRVTCTTAAATNATLGVIGFDEVGPCFTSTQLLASNGGVVCDAGNSTGGTFTVSGHVNLASGSVMATYGSAIDPGPTSIVVRVGGTVALDATSMIHPWSHPTNGGSATFYVRNLTLPAGAQINADGKGFQAGQTFRSNGYGPGKGIGYANSQSSGAGYGGQGGRCSFNPSAGGGAYGSSNAPALPGSGGGYGYGRTYERSGRGGGLIAIEASGTLMIDGTISANGDQVIFNTRGGGSGGGIHLRCGTLAGGGTGIIRAHGGPSGGSDGAGGGGRVAIWRVKGERELFTATATKGSGGSTAGGTGAMSMDGTVVWDWLHPAGTTFIVR